MRSIPCASPLHGRQKDGKDDYIRFASAHQNALLTGFNIDAFKANLDYWELLLHELTLGEHPPKLPKL